MAEATQNIPEQLLDMAAKQADSAEVVYQDAEDGSVEFQDNKLKSVSTRAVRGVGLRVIHEGRIGFSCTNDMNDLNRVVKNALASAAFGQEAKFEFPDRVNTSTQVKHYDRATADLTMERAADITREGIAAILEAYPDTHCAGGISRNVGRFVLCNTRGLRHEEESTVAGMGLSGFMVRGESFLWVDEGESSCRFSSEILPMARKLIEWIRLSEKEVSLGSEKLPVLFTSHAINLLLATFEANTNGKTVQKGASVLADRMDEKILDERVTIWDDPLVDYATGSCVVDAEGVTACRKPLFENGVLRNFVFDLQTAGIMGKESTGNGMRGYSSLPRPSNTNIRVAPGRTPYKELLAGMKRGLLIDQALGAGQSNVLAGAFSVNVELGFLVEDGEIVGRVKDCMLSGNAFEAFNNVRDLSAETEWHGSSELPAVCFESLSVVGREH